MDANNVISMVDDFNLAATVSQIKEFEEFLAKDKTTPRWKYIIVDEKTGQYALYHPTHGLTMKFMDNQFLYSLKLSEINLYDLEAAKELCKELNEAVGVEPDQKIQFTPIGWRRYCIIHLAALYDVIKKMDEKGKTKRFFASC